VAFLQSPGRVPLFIVMSSSRAGYGTMASPPSFRISPETPSGPTDSPSGPTDLFFPIAAKFFVMNLVSMVKVSLEILSCIFGILYSL